jgi:hypothetical protein
MAADIELLKALTLSFMQRNDRSANICILFGEGAKLSGKAII